MIREVERGTLWTAVGTTLVAVGTYAPWLMKNATLPPDAVVPWIYYPRMSTGFEPFDAVLLGLVVSALAVRTVSSRARLQTVVTLLAGVGTMAFCVYYLSGDSYTGLTDTFVPALGWYLTVLGGVVLTAVGGLEVPSLIRRAGDPVADPAGWTSRR